MPSSLTDDIQQIWWLYGWSDDRSFGWSVGWWVSCPENGNDSEPIIGHLSGISESLADFLNWKMQIFEGALLCPLFLEVQTVGRENWKELKRQSQSRANSLETEYFDSLPNEMRPLPVKCVVQECPKRSPIGMGIDVWGAFVGGRDLHFVHSRWDFEFVLLLQYFAFVTALL